MAETILPGTYISVRDEGLITAGRVATGNIGIVGTASRGPIDEVQVINSLSEAKEIFGEADDWVAGRKDELTLIRALEFIFGNGGRTVYAVRTALQTAQSEPSKSSYKIKDGTDAELTVLEAVTPGTWGNEISIQITNNPAEPATVEEVHDGNSTKLNRNIQDSPDNFIQITKATTGKVIKYNLIYIDETQIARVNTEDTIVDVKPDGTLFFTANNGEYKPEAGDKITARYRVPIGKSQKVEIIYAGTKQTYIVADAPHLEELIKKNKSKSLVTVKSTPPNPEDRFGKLLKEITDKMLFGIGADTSGTNGEKATAADYTRSLQQLVNPIINIVILAGQSAADEMNAALIAHINNTKDIKRERIGLIGTSETTDAATIIGQKVFSEDRIIFVGPGLKLSNGNILPGAYTAAAVAGLLASLPVQASPTNKTLNIPGLATEFNSGNLERLVQNNVLAVEKRDGFRIVKGITTSSNSAWHQITTRRIVDYAIYGVRSGCNPYIGKLNNERVRGALKATIDAFLTRMVNDEALITYELDVTATRPQEIAGEVMVTMTLKPTFSIDFIMVTMYLN